MGIHRPLPLKPAVKSWVGSWSAYRKHLEDNGGRDPNTLYTILNVPSEIENARDILEHYKEKP